MQQWWKETANDGGLNACSVKGTEEEVAGGQKTIQGTWSHQYYISQDLAGNHSALLLKNFQWASDTTLFTLWTSLACLSQLPWPVLSNHWSAQSISLGWCLLCPYLLSSACWRLPNCLQQRPLPSALLAQQPDESSLPLRWRIGISKVNIFKTSCRFPADNCPFFESPLFPF